MKTSQQRPRALPGLSLLLAGLMLTTGTAGEASGPAAAPSTPAPAAATTFTVNSTGDGADNNTADNLCNDGGGNCTLRAAIQQANSADGTDTINFSVTGTINLAGPLPDITTDVNINGPGSGLLAVRRDTGGHYRIFTVGIGASVTISGLTITNGRTADGAPGSSSGERGGGGGGVSNEGTLTLAGCVITGNSTGNGGAAGPGGFGGPGGPGGGVYNQGTLTMTDCTVTSNSTGDGGSGGHVGSHGGTGGGVSNLQGALTLTNCVISNNNTGAGALGTEAGLGGHAGPGGGVYSDGGTLDITNTVVSNNVTAGGVGNGSGGVGGGIVAGGSSSVQTTSTLTNVTVKDNRTGDSSGTAGEAPSGGGLYNGGNMTVNGIIVSGNVMGAGGPSGDFGGGGVFNWGTLTVLNGTFSGNRAGVNASGGGLWNVGSLSLTNCTIAANSAHRAGPGIYSFNNPSASVSARNTIVAGNTLTNTPNAPQVTGVYTSQGHNLIGVADGSSTGFVNGVNGDRVGTAGSPLDPLLAPLGNYGGPTQTHALLPGSPAINAGTSTGAPAQDQRGVGRVGAVDVGSFESRGFQLTATAGTPQSAPIFTAFGTPMSVTVTSAFGEPTAGGRVTFAAPAGGASGTFSGSPVVSINSGGVATAPAFTANGIAGSYSVTASVGSSSTTFSLTNLKGNQTITFDVIPDKTYGDANFTISATASSGLPVSFGTFPGSSCTVTGNTVHINGAGICRITATQFGDSNYNGAAAVSRDFNIAPAPTSVAVSSSVNPSAAGQSVTFTATVTSPAGPVPGSIFGSVNFFDGGVAIPNCTSLVNSGQATCTTSSLSPGVHVITAQYTTTSQNFTGSTGTLPGGQTVNGGFNFSQSTYAVNERGNSVTVTVQRAGDTSQAGSVDYATDDGSIPSVAVPCSSVTGIALERCDYTRTAGTLSFAAGETQKTFVVFINDDSYTEGFERSNLRLSNPTGGLPLGLRSAATLEIADDLTESGGNPIDDSAAFVRQHYYDFLNREPDASGLAFWTGQLTGCGSDAACADFRRVSVSQAFFLSTEFQRTGYQVIRVFKASFTDGAARPRALPRLHEFLRDTQELQRGVVVGQGDWEQRLGQNTLDYARRWVEGAEFVAQFPAALGAGQYVDKLFQNSEVAPTAGERAAALAAYGAGGTEGRAQALLSVTGSGSVYNRQYNPAAVLMQYFGYLRRNPYDPPELNLDFGGYDFWLTKLNNHSLPGEDVRNEETARARLLRAEMVRSFIVSGEYRARFGTP